MKVENELQLRERFNQDPLLKHHSYFETKKESEELSIPFELYTNWIRANTYFLNRLEQIFTKKHVTVRNSVIHVYNYTLPINFVNKEYLEAQIVDRNNEALLTLRFTKTDMYSMARYVNTMTSLIGNA